MCCRGRVAPLDPVEFDDPAVSARAAGMELRFNIPIFSGFGQFSLYILALEKQRFCAPSHQRFRESRSVDVSGASARAVTQSTGPAILSTISPMSARCTVPGDAVTRIASRRKRPSWRLRSTRWTCGARRFRQRAGQHDAGKAAAAAEVDPRSSRMEPGSKAAADRRYGGSTDSEASTARPDWFWPATPGAARHSDRAAPLFHVKRG